MADHINQGACPDAVTGPNSRDPLCPACRAMEAAGAPEMPIAAWRDDGSTRSGSRTTAFRVVTDETRRDMPKAAVEAYTDALVRLADARAYGQAMAEHARTVALEEGFEAGWRVVARDWAMRDDLLADIGSPAYLADMTRAIRAAAQTQGGT
jgi:hypothetical protein